METTKIVKEVDAAEFKGIISKYSSNIVFSSHTFDRIGDAQRKIFNVKELMRVLLQENPVCVGLQLNGRYAAFYKRKFGALRMIVEIKGSRLEIITFLNSRHTPNLKRLENDKKTS